MGKRLYSLVMFLVVSVLGGLLASGLVVPIVGMTASGAATAAQNLDTLPTALKETPQWERSRLLNADGSVLAYFYEENRVYVELDKISETMQKAQVAIEDHRFYEHGAMDLQGTLRAMVSTAQGATQGGSSLTQQYVRLVLVEQAMDSGDKEAQEAATETTVARKIRELRYSVAVEEQFTKDQILERYLNIAYYGDGAYGVEAAAKHYFGVHAKDLNLAQSAMLAGLVRNPVAANPRTFPVPGIARRDSVIDRMLELKLVTQEEADEAKATKFDPKKMKYDRLGCANSKLPFICDYAYKTLLKLSSLGGTVKERVARIKKGGLTITTQIDPAAQKVAQKVVSKRVDARDPAVSVVVMVDPQTGLIHAMAQSRPKMGKNWKKGETFYNYAVGESMGGADGYAGGSTFKVFVAAAALDNGFGVNTSFKVKYHRNYQGEVFPICDGRSVKVTKRWVVDNPESGAYDMLRGTAQSVNNYYVPLEQKVGLCPTVKMAETVGLELASGEDLVNSSQNPSFTLGTAEITPLSMVTAYGTFANRGKRCNPIILKSIKTSEGTKLKVPSAGCNQVISEDLADAVNKVYRTPYTSGTLRGANIPGYALAGKTGTVPGNRAAWTVGYTPNLVTAAVISVDNNKRFKKFWKAHPGLLRRIRLPKSGTVLTGFGADAGALLMRPAMTKALKDIGKKDSFHEPSAAILRGHTAGIPSCSGMSLKACRAALTEASFGSYVFYRYSDIVPEGGIISLARSGSAPVGSDIGIILSRGPKPEPKQPTESPTPKKGK